MSASTLVPDARERALAIAAIFQPPSLASRRGKFSLIQPKGGACELGHTRDRPRPKRNFCDADGRFNHSFDAIYSRKNCHRGEIANRCSWRSRSRVNCGQHPHCYSEIGDGHPEIAFYEDETARSSISVFPIALSIKMREVQIAARVLLREHFIEARGLHLSALRGVAVCDGGKGRIGFFTVGIC